jgi:putative PEP-CTERM system TPR-repeat lipoprotein
MINGRLYRAIAVVMLVAAVAACGRGDPASFIASARSYMAKSDYPAAIIELKNALKGAPDNAEARFLLAKALLESGDVVSAETEARKALDLKYPPDDAYPVLARSLMRQGEHKKLLADVDDGKLTSPDARAEVLTARGFAYLSLGQSKEALQTIERALAAQPKSVNARVARAVIAATQGDAQGALKIVDAALVDAPSDIDGLLLKADLEAALNKSEDAIRTQERIVAIKPDSMPARLGLISNLIRLGQLDKAAEQLDALKKIAPRDPRTMYSEALIAYVRRNMPAAREAIERVVQTNPEHLPSRYLSALIYYQLGSYAAAEDALRAVLAKAPNNDSVRRILAATYLKRGRATQALETLEPSLARVPNDGDVLRTMGEIHFALNNLPKSTEYFERANALDKGNTASRVRLAQVRLATGDSGRALADLENLATAEPKRNEPDLALINAHISRREYDKALAAATALEAKQPASPVGPNAKGVVYMVKRDFPKARASFERALAIEPEYSPALQNLARVDVAQRDFAGARKRYEQMLAKDPKSETALLALAELLAISRAPPADIRAALQRAIAANPTSARSRLALISYNSQVRDWPAAIAAAQAAQAALPDNAQIVEMLGATQQLAGETNQALATLRRAAEMQPENPAPLLRLADAQIKAKDYDGATATLRNAVAVRPDNSALWTVLAGVYVDAGRADAGIAEARKIQRERPDRATGFALEGDIFARQQKWSEATAAYRTAFARQPSANVAGRLHGVLIAAGKQDEANAVVQKWLSQHPDDVLLRAYLAQRSLISKDYRAAVQQLRPAVQIEPDNVVLLNNLAWALGELNDPAAVEYAERAYALGPGSAATADTYGWLLVKRGDVPRGLELLRKAVELAPGDVEIRLHLAKALLKSGDKAAARKELDVVMKPESAAPLRAEAGKLLKEL